MTEATRSSRSPLLTLVELGRRARLATGSDELAFLFVNDTRSLQPYRQAALWFAVGGVRCLSGVLQVEANVPFVQWLEQVCAELAKKDCKGAPWCVRAQDLPPALAAEWGQWLPAEGVWVPLPADPAQAASSPGGLLLAAEQPAGEATLAVLEEWRDIWLHAWRALLRPSAWSCLNEQVQQWWQRGRQGPWWRRRPWQMGLALLLLFVCPVRLSVLAPGELVPANPAVVRAPLEGVIDKFHVRPNERVQAGQPLFSFDETALASRLDVARQVLNTAQAEYRQMAQLALNDARSKGQLAVLLGRIGEKQAEVEFLSSQLSRSRVTAPLDGVAIFDDPAEWLGRPVQVGERVMKVAQAEEAEIEAWVPVGDAIPLLVGSPVNLYLAASPFSSVGGSLRYMAHDALPRPDGSYAYRIRASLRDSSSLRIGLKGTARLQGDWVPLGYWVLRRPLALVRQFLVW